MKLGRFLEVLKQFDLAPQVLKTPTGPPEDSQVFELVVDSREEVLNRIFVCLAGTSVDTHHKSREVSARAPWGLIVEHPVDLDPRFQGFVIKVESTRRAVAIGAELQFGRPTQKLALFGITGTNGKTSCSYMVEHLLNSHRVSCGVMGTVEHRLGEHRWITESTTPSPLGFRKRLVEMLERGAQAVALEVSSHALDQARVEGAEFASVHFTNLTRDHLDYHGSIENYFRAKQRLFDDLLWSSDRPVLAVIHADDVFGSRMRISARASVLSYGESAFSDVQYGIQSMDFRQSVFWMQTPWGRFAGRIPMGGKHNVANAVGSLLMCLARVGPIETLVESLAHFPGVPGRLQSVPNGRGVHVYIDYAHTPDALENVLSCLVQIRREAATQVRLKLVFGCGGDRDQGKRPLMAQIAEKWADDIYVTSDNPRTEDPQKIVEQIIQGFSMKKHQIVLDRRQAIARALSDAQAGDIVLIAGKGHEDYQVVGTEKLAFSDVAVALEVMR